MLPFIAQNEEKESKKFEGRKKDYKALFFNSTEP